MSRPWQTVRVFISSTFKDMHAERDYLVRFVFPQLREEMLHRRIHFVDVDLRWGVKDGDDAVLACREMIEECHPRFLCILGGRWGSVLPGAPCSITEDEVRYGVLDRMSAGSVRAHFYFRDDDVTAQMPADLRDAPGSEGEQRVRELKQVIRDAGFQPVTYTATWDAASQRLTGLEVFGEQVYADLLADLLSDPKLRGDGSELAARDEFTEELLAMEAFVETQTDAYVLGSRESLLKELMHHALAPDDAGYAWLVGPPGSGKSALLAYLSGQPSLEADSSVLLLRYFVGATPGSTNISRVLRHFCRQLKVAVPALVAPIPDDLELLRNTFTDFLQQTCAKRRVVILLDGVNQLEAAGRDALAHWLPDPLPVNARLILSAPTGEAFDQLRNNFHPARMFELPPLTRGDGADVIDRFCGRYGKQFDAAQRAALLNKTQADTPLYLLAALEELRTKGDFQKLMTDIDRLPATAPKLFDWILARLEQDPIFTDDVGKRIGPSLLRAFGELLASSRHGLSETELAELLQPGDLNHEPPVRHDARGNVAALLRLLRPYLLRRGELVDFHHLQFREAVATRYLADQRSRLAAHLSLAAFFRRQADPDGNEMWNGQSRRGLSELLHHLLAGQQWDDAAKLVSPAWRNAKRQMFGTDASFIADLAVLAETPVSGKLDDAAHVASVALAGVLKDAGRQELRARLEELLKSGDYEESLRWADGAGLLADACQLLLERTAAGYSRPTPELFTNAALRWLETAGAAPLAKFIVSHGANLLGRGYDLDLVSQKIVGACAATSTRDSDWRQKGVNFLLVAFAPVIKLPTHEALWDVTAQVIEAMAATTAAELAGICAELVPLASHCPPSRRAKVLQLVTHFARRAAALPMRDASYRHIALRGCGQAAAFQLDAPAIQSLSQGDEMGIGGQFTDHRTERTAFRLGALQSFVERQAWDDAEYLARHFIQPGAKVEAYTQLLTQGPLERIGSWETDFLTAWREAQVMCETSKDRSVFGAMAMLTGAEDPKYVERLMTRSEMAAARSTLGKMDSRRALELGRVQRYLDIRPAVTTLQTSAPPLRPKSPSFLELIDGIVAAWNEGSAHPAAERSPRRVTERDSPEDVSLTAHANEEANARGESILRKTTERYVPGPNSFLLLRSQFSIREVWNEKDSLEKAQRYGMRWGDSACTHVREVIADITGVKESWFFGPSLGEIQRFGDLRQACESAIHSGSQHAAGLVRCLSLAAQNLRSFGPGGRIGEMRLRAKLVVGHLIGTLAARELRQDVRRAFELAQANRYVVAFSFRQVADELTRLLLAQPSPPPSRIVDAVMRLIEEAKLPEPHAAFIKARWVRHWTTGHEARGLLEAAHHGLMTATGQMTDKTPPAELRDLHLACLAREMARVDGPTGFEWAKAIQAPRMAIATLCEIACSGVQWREVAKREAIHEALRQATLHGVIAEGYEFGAHAIPQVANTPSCPEFPPISWEELCNIEPPMLTRLGEIEVESLGDWLDSAVAHAAVEARSKLVTSLARTSEIPLEVAVRATRHLIDLPRADFVTALTPFAAAVAGRGKQQVASAIAARLAGLREFAN